MVSLNIYKNSANKLIRKTGFKIENEIEDQDPSIPKLIGILTNRKWQDYVYIQCEYKSTKQKIKHLLREENKVKENKIS